MTVQDPGSAPAAVTIADRAFAVLAHVVVRFRWLVVAAWIALVVITSSALPSLSSEVNNNNSQFLPASTPSSRAASLASPILGSINNNSRVMIVAARTNGRINAADLPALVRVVAAVRKIPRVFAARVLAVSADRSAVTVLIQAHVNLADISRQKTLISRLQHVLVTARPPPGLELRLAGQVATNVANQVNSQRTGNQTQLFTFVFIILLLLVIFRSVLAPLLTLLPAAVSLLVSMRLIGELGAHGLKISEITQLLLIILILGAGTDYGLFLVFRVREEIRRGLEPRMAVERALIRVGESITASAGTVILAVLTLLFASFGIYHDLGIPLAIGVAMILLAGLTLLPALLAIFGKAAFWPSHPKPGQDREGAWGKIAARLIQRPALTLIIGVVFFGALAVAALGYYSSGFGGAASAPKGTSAAAGNALVARKFPASSANPANIVLRYATPVWERPAELALAQASLMGSGRFSALLGPLAPNGTALTPAAYARLHARLGNPLKLSPIEPPTATGISPAEYNAYRATAGFVGPGGRVIQFEASLRAGGQQSTGALNATPQIRRAVAQAARASGATASGLAGEAAALYDVSETSNHDLINIIPIAILAIALLLAVVLRSLVAPIYLIISVALSYLAALGLSTIIFIDIAGDKGLTFILPFLMFIFLLALGEDYNILVMTRIREEARTLPLREAVVRAIARTGSTVTSAGLVLAGTFGVLGVVAGSSASGSQVRAIGFGLAIGILLDTFVVRTVLVPATVTLLGRRNWWPAAMSRRPEPEPPSLEPPLVGARE
ncbi:MAG TPA: MMPL family transporter [Solirubrobacteraceae bacterium]|nr:MMPL family transporter [Solirubrobacteraceae bacterium]